MFYKGLALLALAGLAASAAAAQSDGAAAPDHGSLCTREGGFGYRFGAPPPAPGPLSTPYASHVRLDPRFAPFIEADVGATRWSQRTHTIVAEASRADPEAAAALAAEIRRGYEARGWIVPPRDADNVYLYSERGGLDLQRPTGARIELSLYGRVLVFTCSDMAGFTTHFAELRDGPPVGIARPQPPVRPQLPVVDAAQCDDPVRQQALAARPEELAGPVMIWGTALTRYQELLTAWKASRFIATGRWTREQANRFMIAMFNSRPLGESMMRSAGLLQELVLTLAATQDTPREICLGLVRLEALMRRVATHVEAQWTLIEAAYDAEARRLGVRLN